MRFHPSQRQSYPLPPTLPPFHRLRDRSPATSVVFGNSLFPSRVMEWPCCGQPRLPKGGGLAGPDLTAVHQEQWAVREEWLRPGGKAVVWIENRGFFTTFLQGQRSPHMRKCSGTFQRQGQAEKEELQLETGQRQEENKARVQWCSTCKERGENV